MPRHTTTTGRPIEPLEIRRMWAVNLGVSVNGAGVAVAPGGAAGPTVNVGVGNVGKTTSPAGTHLRLYASTDRTLDAADLRLADVAVGRLASRKGQTTDIPVAVPADTAKGNYFLIARIDDSAAYVDTDPTNNQYVTSEPQLIVGDLLESDAITGTTGDDRISVVNEYGVDKVVNNGIVRYRNRLTAASRLTVDLGAGDDLFDGATTGLTIVASGGRGNDTIIAGGGEDTLSGGAGHDRLFGGDSSDVLEGGGGRDTLDAGPGPDRLFGGSGNDVLIGGGGHDRLYGGPGDDAFYTRDGLFDYLYGESGTDNARRDDGDLVLNDDIETTLA